MLTLDKECIFRIAPKFSGEKAESQKRIVQDVEPILSSTLADYEIDSFLRVAHFLAQVTHECAGWRTTEEFASGDAYEGRKDLGNTQKGDGRRYKGRGLIQLTGRANYRRIGAKLILPIEDEPELAADPKVSLKIACEYWTGRNINVDADRDDLIAVTRKINGGTNGLEDRRDYLKRAKAVLASLAAGAAVAKPFSVLHRGMVGPEVEALQVALRQQGFMLAVDQEFGAATELAVKTFQAARGMVPDGIVGAFTWSALSGALQTTREAAPPDTTFPLAVAAVPKAVAMRTI